ncbi:MAG TPA: hypothetical protein VHS09_07490, partial [Polyangiaceae bacterium]|nr:hypothetical protein [Polyangiaceae bacterium]
SKNGLALAAGVLVASACHRGPTVTTRTVTAWVPSACAADGGAYAEYYAYGDYEPAGPPATGHLLGAVGTTLTELDAEARSLVMTASETQRAWEGVGPVPASGEVDVLLLPTLSSCPLTQSVGARTGSTMAPIGGGRVLIVGGTGAQVPSTYVARLDTGEVDSLGTNDLQTPRTATTVTAFGDGALVAGGLAAGNQVLDDAEVYTVASGGFVATTIALSGPRMEHGAVVLVSGQTLLVGGLASTDPTSVLGSMELVDPTLNKSIPEGVGQLEEPRRNPTVLRLASGEILVAGGFDADGSPARTLEWFEHDGTASLTKKPQMFVAGVGSAFVALAAGGALAVVPPPTPTPGFENVWVIGASGAPVAAAPLEGTLTDPVLFGGAGGAPVLWTGGGWLQWQPYAGSFGEIAVLDAAPAVVGDATCSPDPGAAMWLDPTNHQLTLLRFDTRNEYSSLPGPLLVAGLVTGADDTSPDELDAVSWNSGMGLTLQGGAAFVTDRTYADVDVSVVVDQGPAVVSLRDVLGVETQVPGETCTPAAPAGGGYTLQVQRRGATVTWSTDGGITGTCGALANGDARVSVGVRAGGTTAGVVTDFSVTRVGSP